MSPRPPLLPLLLGRSRHVAMFLLLILSMEIVNSLDASAQPPEAVSAQCPGVTPLSKAVCALQEQQRVPLECPPGSFLQQHACRTCSLFGESCLANVQCCQTEHMSCWNFSTLASPSCICDKGYSWDNDGGRCFLPVTLPQQLLLIASYSILGVMILLGVTATLIHVLGNRCSLCQRLKSHSDEDEGTDFLQPRDHPVTAVRDVPPPYSQFSPPGVATFNPQSASSASAMHAGLGLVLPLTVNHLPQPQELPEPTTEAPPAYEDIAHALVVEVGPSSGEGGTEPQRHVTYRRGSDLELPVTPTAHFATPTVRFATPSPAASLTTAFITPRNASPRTRMAPAIPGRATPLSVTSSSSQLMPANPGRATPLSVTSSPSQLVAANPGRATPISVTSSPSQLVPVIPGCATPLSMTSSPSQLTPAIPGCATPTSVTSLSCENATPVSESSPTTVLFTITVTSPPNNLKSTPETQNNSSPPDTSGQSSAVTSSGDHVVPRLPATPVHRPAAHARKTSTVPPVTSPPLAVAFYKARAPSATASAPDLTALSDLATLSEPGPRFQLDYAKFLAYQQAQTSSAVTFRTKDTASFTSPASRI